MLLYAAAQSLKKRGKAKNSIDAKKEEQEEDIPIQEPEKVEEPERRKSKRKATNEGSEVSPKPPKSRKTTSTGAKDSTSSANTKASMKPKKSKARNVTQSLTLLFINIVLITYFGIKFLINFDALLCL